MPTPTSGTSVARTTLTGNAAVDCLLDGYHWLSSTIGYSFIAPAVSSYDPAYPNLTLWTQISAFTAVQQGATARALGEWSNVANLHFSSSADNATSAGTIRLGFSASYSWGNSAGTTYLPNSYASGGDVWLDPYATDGRGGAVTGTFANSGFQDGSYAFFTLLHELGHALGLKHPFDSSTDGGGQSIDGTSSSGWDARVFTVMSYATLADHTDAIGFTFNPTTPMLLDIEAMQALYGANYTYNAGDTVYTFNDNAGQFYFQTIWDGGGTNTIAYSGTHPVTLDLRDGNGSSIGNTVYAYTATNLTAYAVKNVWIAYGTKIQVADLSASNAAFTINANDYGDTLVCGAGNGTVHGGNGGDTVVVGSGAETITCGTGADTVVFGLARASYSISYSAGVFHVSGPSGSETISGAETFKFSDVSLPSTQLQVAINPITLAFSNGTVHTTAANDLVTGFAGLNAVVYTGQLSQYSLNDTAGQILVQDSVGGRDGTDTLVNIQRLIFADKSVAFDLSASFATDVIGNAGVVAKIIGAVYGAASIAAHPDFVGIGLGFADAGMSYANLMQLALGAKLGPAFTNEQEIQLLYGNLLGHAASTADVAFWGGTLATGQFTHVTLAEMAADSPANAANINLVGLAQNGVAYS
jgi:serralysin